MDYRENEAYLRARKRVKKKRAIIKEFGILMMVGVINFFINITTSPQYPWFLWVVGPWFVILTFRAIAVWSSSYFDRWEEKAMEAEIERYNNSMLRSHHVTDDEDVLEIEDYPQHTPSKQKWNEQDLV